MEGYDFDFVGEDMQDYKCPICLMLLRDAFVMPCSHSACKLCLRKWAEQGNSGVYHCPSCQTAYDKEKVGETNEGRLIDRVITKSLKVKCKQHLKSCDWIGKISDYEFHETICLYTSVLCGYASCDIIVCRKDLKEHQDDCAYRTIQCEFCSQQVPYKQLEDHHKRCDYFEVTCPQLCHGESMGRKDVQVHIEYHCPNTEMKCPLHEIGCMEIMRRKDIENHINNSILQHTPLMLAFTFDLETEIKQLKDSSSSQSIEIEELEKNQLEQCEGIKELKQFKTGFQIEFEEMKASTSLMISELEEKLKEKAVNVTSSPHQKVEWKSLHGNGNVVVKKKDTAKRNYIPNKEEVKIKDTARMVDVRIKNATAYKDGAGRNYITKEIMPAVKFHEDIHTFNEISQFLSNKGRKIFVERINSKPELALICNSFGQSLLHSACYRNNTTCMVVLLKFGCPINHATKQGCKSIHWAAINGSVDAAKMLFSIDETLVNSINFENGFTPLHYAVNCNKAKFVRFLLQQPGIQVNIKDYRNMIAYEKGNERIKKIITANKYEVKIKDTINKANVMIRDATAYADGIRRKDTTRKVDQCKASC